MKSRIGNRNKWLLLIHAAIMFSLASLIFLNPVWLALGIATMVAIAFIIKGVTGILLYIASSRLLKMSGLVLLEGIISIVLSLFLFVYPSIALEYLVFLVGLWLIFGGVSRVSSAIVAKNFGAYDWIWILIIGALFIIFGFIVILHPGFYFMTFTICLSISFVMSGAGSIIEFLKMD